MLSFANGSQFGNNAFISPGSKVNDGVLELCVLRKIPFFSLPYFAFQLFTKRAIKSKYLEIIPFKNLKLISVTDKIHIDGEPVIAQKEFELIIKPLALTIIAP